MHWLSWCQTPDGAAKEPMAARDKRAQLVKDTILIYLRFLVCEKVVSSWIMGVAE